MTDQQVAIPTTDGVCPTLVFTPDGDGAWPAVIFYMDALAIRPALMGMARRLANAGYVVLLPDMYYRFGPYAPVAPKNISRDNFPLIIAPMMAIIDNQKAAADTAAFLEYLDTRTDVAGPRAGAVGFCMGGGMALTAAGAFPARIAAVASFHGVQLATDAPDSPHLAAPLLRAEIYVAGAEHDGGYPPEMNARLDQALRQAGVPHVCEIVAGARHGWMLPDFAVYDFALAERGWTQMLALFARRLAVNP